MAFRTQSLILGGILLACLSACVPRETTPPEVEQAYRELKDTLDPDLPGASIRRLEEFREQNAKYAIAPEVRREIRLLQNGAEKAYLKARDLAREGDFERAAAMLEDLAGNLPESKPGKQSKEFLDFEFDYLKATRLTMQGRPQEAGALMKEVLKRPLTEVQMVAALRLLDGVSTAGQALDMARLQSLKASGRSLQVLLRSLFAENDRYPARLTLDSPEIAYLGEGGAFRDIVGAIEGYAASGEKFSFILVGKDPRYKVRVTHERIEDFKEPPDGGAVVGREEADVAD
jgi:hypothetical protein